MYVARSYSCLVIGGEGEGSAEYATECHIFNFMENYMYLKNPKFMFKHKPKVAMPLLNMRSVNHERKITQNSYPHVGIMCFVFCLILTLEPTVLHL